MMNGAKVFYEGAKANASQLNGWANDYWRAECERATLELDNRALHKITGSGNMLHRETIPLEEQPAWTNAWLGELFVGWLNGGPEPPNSLADNIQCAALLFAAIESAHKHEPVDVQRFLADALSIDQ